MKKILLLSVTIAFSNIFGQTLSEKQKVNTRATGYAIVASKNPGVQLSVFIIPWDGVNTLEYNANNQINNSWHPQAVVKGQYFNQPFDGADFTDYSSVITSQSDFDLYKSTGTQWWIVCSTIPSFSSTITSDINSGNVGIGASTPEARLHVADGSGAGILFNMRPTSFTPNKGAQISWSESSSTRAEGDLVIAPRTDTGASIAFYTNDGSQVDERVVIKPNGFVGIGSKNPDAELTVKGRIHSEEVKVDLAVPADYVFQKYYTGNSTLKPEYTMLNLEEVEKFTKENNHLPNIPSAKEIREKGLNVGEMSNLLLQKIEELTLYTIEQNKLIKEQQQRIEKLENANKK